MTRKNRPTKEENVGRLTRKAAEIIEDKGWAKGVRKNKDSGYCAIGSLNIAFNGNINGSLMEYSYILGTWLGNNMPIPDSRKYLVRGDKVAVELINDNIFTSKEEAVAWLNKAADALDPRGANKLH